MHTLLLLLHAHGDDPRMELIYFLASVMTVLLPVGIFGYIGYKLFRAYRAEKQQASSTTVRSDGSP